MTKDAEIQALTEFTDRMISAQTYIGDWLREVKDQVTADIRSDFVVEVPLPRECASRSKEMIEKANRDAEAILIRARKEADRLIAEAHEHRRGIIGRAAAAALGAHRELSQFS